MVEAHVVGLGRMRKEEPPGGRELVVGICTTPNNCTEVLTYIALLASVTLTA